MQAAHAGFVAAEAGEQAEGEVPLARGKGESGPVAELTAGVHVVMGPEAGGGVARMRAFAPETPRTSVAAVLQSLRREASGMALGKPAALAPVALD